MATCQFSSLYGTILDLLALEGPGDKKTTGYIHCFSRFLHGFRRSEKKKL
jgi:hypothetical protein